MKNTVLFSLAGLLLFSGCGGELPSLESPGILAAYGDDATVFRALYTAEVANLNYLVTSSSVDTAICANVIDALVDYDSEGNIIPGLAESWESNEDMTEWTFHLRDGITWVDYNGEYYADVVADDWVMAAEYVNDAANETDCQYMYSTGAVVKNAQEYYEYTSYLLHPEDFETPPPEVRPSDIGVTAKDDRTLVYTLDQPCPFFPSVLSYTTYLPVCRKYLKEVGTMFARNNETLLYNGAFLLHYFQPLEKQVLVKNVTYWDKDRVYLDRVENIYDPDAAAVGVDQYLSGAIDKAIIEPEKLDRYLSDPKTKDLVKKSRPDSSFSYFYCFNFMPLFEEEYEPENWAKAVVNENFRKAVTASMDRVTLLSVYEPYDPESLLNNTVTPPGTAVTSGGKDYTQFPALLPYTEGDTFDVDAAGKYRDAAKEELTAAGVTFPIKVLMPYNPATVGWGQEASLVEQQLEDTLGSDFIDVIVEEGSDTGFLLSVRRSGKYAFMKCRWGADYADPQTWTEPFEDDGEYMFWHENKDPQIAGIHSLWRDEIDTASRIYENEEERYSAFADAEALLLEHSVIVPFSIMSDGYMMSNLNEAEGEYCSYGMARQRFKGMHLMK